MIRREQLRTSQSQVYWQESRGTPPSYPTFSGQLQQLDVAIVGGGMVGLTTAFRLRRSGLSVALFEARTIGEGVTSRSTAKVSALHGAKYSELDIKHGRKVATMYARLNREAVEEFDSWVNQYGWDCDWERRNTYTFATTEQELEDLKRSMEVAVEAGLPVRLTSRLELPGTYLEALEMDSCGQFNPRRYLDIAAAESGRSGTTIFENSRVSGLTEEGVEVNGISVQAAHVVLATHIPILDQGLYFARVFPYRSYVLAAPAPRRLQGMYVNAGTPTHSVRGSGEHLIFAGHGHKTGEESDPFSRYEALADWASEVLGSEEFSHRWSTQDLSSEDSLPMVGPALPHRREVLVATGFAGWGLSNSIAASRLLAQLIRGEKAPEIEVLTPGRFHPIAAGKTLLKENLKAGIHLVKDRFTRDEAFPLGLGQGAIQDRDGDKVAVFRDHDGVEHVFSATCTHIGCVVTWNEAEQSFDCPCHGSRFDHLGQVLNGPAVHGLRKIT
ncbi:MAG: FAD-dependent oxidoreductase [Vulcanimicrobiota bacterium]